MAKKVEAKDNGNGNHTEEEKVEEIRDAISASSMENAIRQTQGTSALKYIVEPGDEINALLMRTSIPTSQSYGVVFSKNMAQLIGKNQFFNYKPGLRELLALMATLPSVENERIKLLVSAIIGDSRMQAQGQQGQGLGQKIKDFAYRKNNETPDT